MWVAMPQIFVSCRVMGYRLRQVYIGALCLHLRLSVCTPACTGHHSAIDDPTTLVARNTLVTLHTMPALQLAV